MFDAWLFDVPCSNTVFQICVTIFKALQLDRRIPTFGSMLPTIDSMFSFAGLHFFVYSRFGRRRSEFILSLHFYNIRTGHMFCGNFIVAVTFEYH